MQNEPSGEYYDYTQTMKPERPWMLAYHQSLVYFIFMASRGGDGQLDKLNFTFEQALDTIRKVNNITAGVPQIVYIIGWHHEGHDSKYPHWNEVNRHLKRDQDETALDSLRWLIREARRYNATVSLHINMFDAYPDSPLWDEYVEKDIIAKDKDGNVIPGKEWGGMTSYQLSYTQEWKHGLAQKRIDDLVEMVPELVEGGTIHIDAFLGSRPEKEARSEPISPYLGYTKEEECATQRKIYRYWRDRGIDVTSEWVTCFRTDRFVGLQAWCWHGGSAVEDLPDELYCTNVMDKCRELFDDPTGPDYADYMKEFCLLVLPWFYKNHPDGNEQDLETMRDGDDICCPALWCDQPTLIAYSHEGCTGKSWALPPTSSAATRLEAEKLTWEGPEPLGTLDVANSSITLDLAPDTAVKLTATE